MLGLLVAIGGGVLLVLFLVIYILSRIKVAGPNEAFIVTGRKGRSVEGADGIMATDLSGQKVVMGASVFVLPVVQKLQVMSLSSRRIHVEIQGAVSKQGIRANLQGVAIVKVGGTEDAIRAAAQRFLHQQAEIEEFTREVLAGALRSIVGRLTIEEIIRDRTAFASAVAEEAEHSMTNQGLVLDTFQLQDILAEGTYLQDLGRPEAARVMQGRGHRRGRARQAGRAGAAGRRGGDRRGESEPIPQAGRHPGRDRRRPGAVRRGRPAGRGRAAAGTSWPSSRRWPSATPSSSSASSTPRCASRPTPSGTGWSRRPRPARTPRSPTPTHERQATIAAAQGSAEQSRLTGEGERSRRAALAEGGRGAKEGEQRGSGRQEAAEAQHPGQGQCRGRRDAEQGRRVRRVRRGCGAGPAAAGPARGGRRPRRRRWARSTNSPSSPPTGPPR